MTATLDTAAPDAPPDGCIKLWSCGGGRQSAGVAALIVQGRLPKPDHVVMAALIVQGRLPKPDHVVMAALEWERKATFRYVNAHIRPAMQSLGIPFSYAPRKKYATVGFWSGEDGKSITLPVYSDKGGKPSKLSEYCSGEWKREVVLRWSNEQPGWKQRGVDNWIGITWEEKHRRRGQRKQWFRTVYPLLDMLPRPMHVSGCLQAVAEVGWPPAPRSRCEHCPNQPDAEWAELTPEEFERACKLDETIRLTDPNAFLHRSLTPLRLVKLDPKHDDGGMFGGCQAGMCF